MLLLLSLITARLVILLDATLYTTLPQLNPVMPFTDPWPT
jgi:hypothetical protein